MAKVRQLLRYNPPTHTHPAKRVQLAFGFERQARCRQIRDTAVLELDGARADVFHIPDDADAGGFDALDRRIGKTQNDVDVVDHHVQHNADINRAERQRADLRVTSMNFG